MRKTFLSLLYRQAIQLIENTVLLNQLKSIDYHKAL